MARLRARIILSNRRRLYPRIWMLSYGTNEASSFRWVSGFTFTFTFTSTHLSSLFAGYFVRMRQLTWFILLLLLRIASSGESSFTDINGIYMSGDVAPLERPFTDNRELTWRSDFARQLCGRAVCFVVIVVGRADCTWSISRQCNLVSPTKLDERVIAVGVSWWQSLLTSSTMGDSRRL